VTWDQNFTVAASYGPILVGEFGAAANSTENDDYADFFARIMPWITLHGYSSTAWSMNTSFNPCLIADWNYDLSFTSGTYVFSSLIAGPHSPRACWRRA
jgi:hypothetical protein